MNKTWLVFKQELITTITRRSFIITLLLIPVAAAISMLVVSLLGQNTTQAISGIFAPAPVTKAEGYIDHSGLVQQIPAAVPSQALFSYSNEEQARQALADGKIIGFYIVPTDYVSSGRITYVRNDFNPISGLEQSDMFRYVLRYNLLGRDQALVDRLSQPLTLDVELLAPSVERDKSNMSTFFVPYAVMMLFYIVIMAAAGYMLNSVTTEKQNRVIEILMVSITPTQMLTGKIVALGLVGLLQTLVWSGTGLVFLRLGGKSLNLPASFQLPVSFLIWGAVFFILGYALYASLMAGVGALVPSLREASQATTVMVIPMIIPLIMLNPIIDKPNGPIAVVLSLFPLTAPVTMMTRLTAGNVPFWHPVLAAFLMVVAAALVIRAVSGMFRAQTLLSGQSFNMGRFVRAMLGKPV